MGAHVHDIGPRRVAAPRVTAGANARPPLGNEDTTAAPPLPPDGHVAVFPQVYANAVGQLRGGGARHSDPPTRPIRQMEARGRGRRARGTETQVEVVLAALQHTVQEVVHRLDLPLILEALRVVLLTSSHRTGPHRCGHYHPGHDGHRAHAQAHLCHTRPVPSATPLPAAHQGPGRTVHTFGSAPIPHPSSPGPAQPSYIHHISTPCYAPQHPPVHVFWGVPRLSKNGGWGQNAAAARPSGISHANPKRTILSQLSPVAGLERPEPVHQCAFGCRTTLTAHYTPTLKRASHHPRRQHGGIIWFMMEDALGA